MTTSFQVMSSGSTPAEVCKQMPSLELYVTIKYGRTSTCKEVSEALKDLFTEGDILGGTYLCERGEATQSLMKT